jgi:hypothetical protein
MNLSTHFFFFSDQFSYFILFFRHLAYVFIIIALVFIVSYDAYRYSYYLVDDNDYSSPILIDSSIARRNVIDPYGLNSILSRFVKRNRDDDIPRKPMIHFIDEEEEDAYN